MSRKDVIREVLADWAERQDLQVTIRQLDELAAGIARAMRREEPWRSRGGMPKGGATPDDARRIAARLEALFSPRPRRP